MFLFLVFKMVTLHNYPNVHISIALPNAMIQKRKKRSDNYIFKVIKL